MAQVEDPASLNRWNDPNWRLITVILIRCGLRISSAVSLAFDCIVADAAGAPYLRYYNTKMKREALVPVDDELVPDDQRPPGAGTLPAGPGERSRCLFPRTKANINGTRPVGSTSYRSALYRWLRRLRRPRRARPAPAPDPASVAAHARHQAHQP